MEDWRLTGEPLWNVEVPSFVGSEDSEPNICLQLQLGRHGANETLKLNMAPVMFDGLLEAMEAAEELVNQAQSA